MPQAFAAGLIGIGVSAGVATAVAQFAFTLLTNIALGAISKALSKRPRNDPPPINVSLRNPIEHRQIVLGTERSGGVFVYYATSGDNNKYLWYVLVYAGHQCEALRDFWLDTVRVANSDINGGAAGGGAVGGGEFSGKLQIWKHLGTSAQTVDTNIDSALTEWTSDHRLRGCAYAVLRMERDDAVWVNGAPQSATALTDGLLAYDPREGSHDPDDPSTWEFTRNPALLVRWYLSGGSVINDDTTRLIRYGMQESDARIDDDYTIASANICDESISGANAPPSGAQPRYECGLVVSTAESRQEILEALLMTMAGSIVIAHGKYRIIAGAYDSPTHDLDESDLYDQLECEDTHDHQRRYNAVAAVYRNEDQEYIEATTPYRTDSAYETQDGGRRIPLEIDLRGVTNQYQAQRLAEIKLRQSRMQRSVKLVGALNLLPVALNETLTYSHTRFGWSNRIFRCVEREFEFPQTEEHAGRVVLTCTRDDPGVWADMLTADYTTGTSVTDVFTNDTPDAPTSLTTTSIPGAVLITVGLPTYLPAGYTVEIYEYTANTPFSSATKIQEGPGNLFSVSHLDTTTRYYWAKIRDAKGVKSSEYPSGNGVAGTAERATDVLTASSASGSITGTAASNQTLLSISVPAQPVESKVVLTLSASMSVTAVELGAAGIWGYFATAVNGSFDYSVANALVYSFNAASTSANAVNVEASVTLAASTAATYNFYVAKGGGGASVSAAYASAVMKAEIIKL